MLSLTTISEQNIVMLNSLIESRDTRRKRLGPIYRLEVQLIGAAALYLYFRRSIIIVFRQSKKYTMFTCWNCIFFYNTYFMPSRAS